MTGRAKFLLHVAILFAVTLAVALGTGALLVAAAGADERRMLLQLLSARAALLIFGALLLAGVCYGIAKWFHAEYVAAARALAEQTEIALGVNDSLRISSGGATELAVLATAIGRLAEEKHRLRIDVDVRAQEQRRRLEEERNRLAALMSELSEGVLVCNTACRILLYNEQARALFATGDGATGALVGLGRTVFTLIDRDQVVHTLEKLEQGLARGAIAPTTRFVAPTGAGRLVKFEAAPYLGSEGGIAGLVFTLSDVSGLLEREAQRLSLLQALAGGSRAPVANIRAAAENLAHYPDMEPERRRQFIDIVAQEALGLSRSIEDALRAYGDAIKASLTLEDMRGADLLSVARRRLQSLLDLEIDAEGDGEGVWLRVDSFALVHALAFLAAKLEHDYRVRRFVLRVRSVGGFAELDLAWSGAHVAHDALAVWECEPMNIGTQSTPLTLRDVLERHGGEAWLQSQSDGPGRERAACFRFLLPAGEPDGVSARPASGLESRPEYYDFDLFAHSDLSSDLQDRRLSELNYTSFDTETTGLEPSAGDEIISIGAVRIVNGRLLRTEFFEQLIDPRRPLNRQSAKIHRIEAAALQGQPTIEQMMPVFHRFCEDTVLVAHNAAFDMRFLELKEASSGVRFAQPVLDTLLLSAFVHPNLDDHRLEAIADRLGVPLVGRHTALGDALVTGEVFVRLLALLTARGIVTLRQALEASRETYYARLQY